MPGRDSSLPIEADLENPTYGGGTSVDCHGAGPVKGSGEATKPPTNRVAVDVVPRCTLFPAAGCFAGSKQAYVTEAGGGGGYNQGRKGGRSRI